MSTFKKLASRVEKIFKPSQDIKIGVANVHELFPLAIYENEISCHQEIKKILLDNYEKEKFPVVEKKDLVLQDGGIIKDALTTETFTGEGHGLAAFHKKSLYKGFFSELLQHVYAYMGILGLRTDNVDIYVMKSWLVIHDDFNQSLPFHVHPESNISFVYYVQTTELSQSIAFENAVNQNALSQDIFNTSNPDVIKDDCMVVEHNRFNFDYHAVPVREGMVVMFPGWRTRHGTQSVVNETNVPNEPDFKFQPRLAIAGDLKIVLRPDRLSTMTLCSSLEYWDKLN
jgi:hypothetical protein